MLARNRLIFLVGLAVTVVGLMALPILPASGGVEAVQQPTVPLTNTPRFTATIPPTNTPRFTPTIAPSATLTPTPTETLTPTPTEAPILPTPTLYYPDVVTQGEQPTAIPTKMARLVPTDENGNPYELLNILLLAHDGDVVPGDPNFHTDTMIVVSINRDTGTVSMLSLPRDLYVYIPNWGMQRLNQAWWYGEAIGWTDGGWGMLRQTILYNFGIDVHYYAMVDFDGFQQIIDTLGGVDVAVDCPIQDQVCTANCEDGIPDNEEYALTTLPVGVHHMDGELALWYARSRKLSLEFDRGRRQQQILRAIWATAKQQGLITQIPDLWDQITSVVETNIPLSEVIALIPLAMSVEPNDIENHFFRKGIETVAWQPPDGQNVQLPDPNGGMLWLLEDFMAPPTQNRLVLENASIEIQNGTPNEGWEIVAADRLVWEGFAPAAVGPADRTDYPDTLIYDYTGSSKGSSLAELSKLLNIRPENIIIDPNPNRTVDFKIVLGASYNSCVDRQINAPDPMAQGQ